MKVFYLLTVFLLFSISDIYAASEDIRVNQLGYFTKGKKVFVVANTTSSSFTLKNNLGEDVFSGTLEDMGNYSKSGEEIKIGDFSSFNTDGNDYYIEVSDKGTSYKFDIGNKVLDGIADASLKAFYYFRASMALDSKYAGVWARAAGHPDTNCLFHASSGHSTGSISSPGGWYDAGDYNKYVVNAGISVGTMQLFAEMYPSVVSDDLNIPKSGNGISDLLDELKYELDWLLTMQDNDGGVFFKITTKSFAGFVMPSDAVEQRYVVGKSTTSTLDFAAMMAQAYRLWKDTDLTFANKCLDAAKSAWLWANNNNDIAFSNPSDISTGEYGNGSFGDEFFWAASELFIATNDDVYKNYISSNISNVILDNGPSWPNVTDLGFFSLALFSSDASFKSDAKDEIVSVADEMLSFLETNPYKIPVNSFYWGSNSTVLNSAVTFAIAYNLTNDEKYLNAVIETNDYIFGKNATGYSFVTGYGDKTPMHPHHRPSASDGVHDPVPGMVVGGANGGQQDNQVYPSDYDAKSYVDIVGSYASNEIAINWNAPLFFVENFLSCNSGKVFLKDVKSKKEDISLKVYPNPFNPATTVSFSLPFATDINLSIYNVNGKLIKNLCSKKLSEGIHLYKFSGKNIASGIYLVKMKYGNMNLTRKILMLK